MADQTMSNMPDDPQLPDTDGGNFQADNSSGTTNSPNRFSTPLDSQSFMTPNISSWGRGSGSQQQWNQSNFPSQQFSSPVSQNRRDHFSFSSPSFVQKPAERPLKRPIDDLLRQQEEKLTKESLQAKKFQSGSSTKFEKTIQEEREKFLTNTEALAYTNLDPQNTKIKDAFHTCVMDDIRFNAEHSKFWPRIGTLVLVAKTADDQNKMLSNTDLTRQFGNPQVIKLKKLSELYLVYLSHIDTQVRTQIIINDLNKYLPDTDQIFSTVRGYNERNNAGYMKVFCSLESCKLLRDQGMFKYGGKFSTSVLHNLISTTDPNCSKLVIKNIPVQTTEDSLRIAIAAQFHGVQTELVIINRDPDSNLARSTAFILVKNQYVKRLVSATLIVSHSLLNIQLDENHNQKPNENNQFN